MPSMDEIFLTNRPLVHFEKYFTILLYFHAFEEWLSTDEGEE